MGLLVFCVGARYVSGRVRFNVLLNFMPSKGFQIVAVAFSCLIVVYHFIYGEGRGVNHFTRGANLFGFSYATLCLFVYPLYLIGYLFIRSRFYIGVSVLATALAFRIILEFVSPSLLYIIVHPIQFAIGLAVLWFTIAYPSILVFRAVTGNKNDLQNKRKQINL